jgi:hypothetical protein
MANHYHLLVQTPEPNLSKGMRRLNQVYPQAFNRRHGRVGYVLQGRYSAALFLDGATGTSVSEKQALSGEYGTSSPGTASRQCSA